VTQGFVLKGNLDRRDFCDTPVFNPRVSENSLWLCILFVLALVAFVVAAAAAG